MAFGSSISAVSMTLAHKKTTFEAAAVAKGSKDREYSTWRQSSETEAHPVAITEPERGEE